MATKVIGLDLGHRAIKAAVLKGTYRGYEVVDFRAHPLPLEELAEAEPEDEDTGEFSSVDGEEAAGEATADPEELQEVGTTLRELQLREAEALLETLDTDDASLVVAIPSTPTNTTRSSCATTALTTTVGATSTPPTPPARWEEDP